LAAGGDLSPQRLVAAYAHDVQAHVPYRGRRDAEPLP